MNTLFNEREIVMKRVKNLFDGVASYKNLQVACNFAARGKKKRKTVARIMGQKDTKLRFLSNLLSSGAYHPMQYNKKTIIDRCTMKVREIYVPKFFPDQIVQWSLMLQLKPIIMRGMYDYSCASIDGRGGLYGINTVKKWLKTDPENTRYCLVTDIKKFYPNINQDILMQKFSRKLKDARTLRLIEQIVRSVPSGLPIGNFTSQWFANFYLQDFDHYVKEQLHIKHYIRYMDDMVFFSSNKRDLAEKRKLIEVYINSEDLTIKPNWQIFKVADDSSSGRPIDFLGYKFYRNYTTMRSKTFLRTTRRLRKVSKKKYLTAKDASAVLSYVARIKVASGNGIYKKYVAPAINLKRCRLAISLHDKKQNSAL